MITFSPTRGRPTRLLAALLLGGTALAGPVLTSPASAQVQHNRYVALGDSYTAGQLIPFPTGEPFACGRSTQNYPHLVADRIDPKSFEDVSCEGATTKHLFESQLTLTGMNEPQLDALTDDTDVVTLGMGLNDLGLAEITLVCGTMGIVPFGQPCKDHYTRQGDEIQNRLDELSENLDKAIEEIGVRSPNANLFLVGYPTLLPDDGQGCWPFAPLASGDVPWLRDIFKRLNDVLFLKAVQHQLAYVDTYNPSVGHDLCKGPGVKWVEGLIPTDIAGPLHLNAAGMRNTANRVLDAFGYPTLEEPGDSN